MTDQTIRALVRGVYDIQKLRIQTGNRIVANFKVKLGQTPGVSEKDLDMDAQLLLEDIRGAYDRITDALAGTVTASRFEGDGVISSFTEYCLVSQYIDLEERETEHFKRIKQVVETQPLWRDFLKGVAGVGPAIAGILLSEIDIRKARYPSSLWKYAGLDVVVYRDGHGEGRSRRSEHLIDVKYTDAMGEEKTRKSITFNPFLKTKLLGVLAPSFLRAKDNKYKRVYYEYKARLENSPLHMDKTKGHRHNMAMRYMIKIFLIDLYVAWYNIEGLEPKVPYHEAKLGMKHAS